MYTFNSRLSWTSDIVGFDWIAVLVLCESFVNIQTLSLVVVAARATISLLLLYSILVAEFLLSATLLCCSIARVISRTVVTENISDDSLKKERDSHNHGDLTEHASRGFRLLLLLLLCLSFRSGSGSIGCISIVSGRFGIGCCASWSSSLVVRTSVWCVCRHLSWFRKEL